MRSLPSAAGPSGIVPLQDWVRRFLFEGERVRGQFVRIEQAWHALREHSEYPQPVRDLLGESVSASILLAATLKFQGTLTLQLDGDGAVRLLVAQCSHDFRVRALARVDPQRLSQWPIGSDRVPQRLQDGMFRHLTGETGRFVVTIEPGVRDVRYQGIVPLSGQSLSESLEAYFQSSEQLPTRIKLAADAHHAAGLLVQRLPLRAGAAREVESDEAWEAAERGIATVEPTELTSQPLENVLRRHFRGRDMRLYAGAAVQFECRCGPERVARMLRALGADELREVVAEQGAVTVTCDFCNKPFRFDAIDVERLFAGGAGADAPASVH